MNNQANNMSSSSNAFGNPNVLSTLDNNSSAMNDKTVRTSQFVSPRSFLNKSGGNPQQQSQILSSNNILMSGTTNQPRISLDNNPNQYQHSNLLLVSYDGGDENYNIHNM